MKKLPKLATLALLTLAMVGCSRNGVSSTSSDSSSASTNTAETTSSTNTEDTSPLSSTTVTTDKSEDSTSSDSSTSAEPSEYEKSLWNTKTKDLMVKYLDGMIIPYTDIGSYTADWNETSSRSSTYLLISGDEFAADKMQSFYETYKTAGWTVPSAASTNMTFTKDAYTVTISKDSDGYFQIKVNYVVVYDESKAPTDWEDEVKDAFTDDLNGKELPYVYLGSPSHYFSYNTTTKTLTIYGYTFNQNIITNAKKVYTDEGWEVEDTSNSYGAGIVASKAYSDSDRITVTMDAVSPTSTSRYSIKAVLSENWDSTQVNAWTSDMSLDINATFGHDLDYFYLGTKSPSYSFTTTQNKLTITGGVYDARTIPLVKTTLGDKMWGVTDTVNGGIVATSPTFDDGSYFKVCIDIPTVLTAKITATVYWIPNVTESTETGYSEEIQKKLAIFLNGNSVPYIYLGSDDVTATFNNSYAWTTLTTSSTGSFVSPKLIDNAAEKFKADGWTVTRSENTNYQYGQNLTAEKIFSATGDKIIATFNTTTYTSKSSLKYQLIEAYDSSYEGSWDSNRSYDNPVGTTDTSSTALAMKTNLDGHTIPYVYLGTKNHNSSWNSTNSTLTIYGGNWNTAMPGNLKSAFEAENATKTTGDSDWEFEITAADDDDLTTATKVIAKKTFKDGCGLIVTLTKPSATSDTYPVRATTLAIAYKDVWGAKSTDWTSTVTSNFTKIGIPSTEKIPYVYLGTDSATSSVTTSTVYSSQTVSLTGAAWDDRVLDEFKTAFASWNEGEEMTRYSVSSPSAYKFITDEDGNKTGIIRAILYRNGTTATSKACMKVFYDALSTSDKLVDWTDANKTVFKNAFTGDDDSILPNLSVNSNFTVAETVKYGNAGSSAGTVTVKTPKGTGFNFNFLLLAYDNLKTNGWDVKLNLCYYSTIPYGYYASISATKTVNGGTFTISSSGTSSNSSEGSISYTIGFHESISIPTGTDAAWSTDIATTMKEQLNGYVLPYFYIGGKNLAYSKGTLSSTNNKALSLKGSTWDDSLVTNMKTALASDTTITDWSYYNDYSEYSKYGVKYVAFGTYTYTIPAEYEEDEDGNPTETIKTPAQTYTKHITLKLFEDTESYLNRPILEIYIA